MVTNGHRIWIWLMPSLRTIAAFALTLALTIGGYFALISAAQAGEVFTGKTPGVAINGYDPVSYFKQKAAVKGSSANSHTWNGVEWHFSSAQNRDAFAANPARYAPQYGGYCAFAAAKDYLAKTDPNAFSIYDGKLFLNYNRSVKRRWDKNKKSFVAAANDNWPGLKKKAQAD